MQGQGIFTMPRLTLGSTPAYYLLYMEAFFPTVKQLEYEAD